MTISEKIFALGAVAPFNRIRAAELALIASVVRERAFAPGESIAIIGQPMRNLFVLVEGTLERHDGAPVPAVLGHSSLLLGAVPESHIRAGDDGAVCLVLSRSHFFTVANEIPSLVVGFSTLVSDV